MSDRQKRSQRLRFLFAAGVSGIALALCVGRATGQISEIDGYDAAVTSQSKAEALSFIKTFSSSHLVGDLIESLPPEVAQEVCADLQVGGPAKARKACEVIRKAFAAQPVVPPAEIAPAAGSAAVDPVSTGADTSTGISSEDETVAGELDAGGTDTAGDTNLFYYLPVVATAPAAGTPAAEPVSSAVTSRGGKGNGGTDESDGIILQTARTVPTASTAAPSVSTSPSASTAAPDVNEPDTSNAQSSSGPSSSSQSSSGQSSSSQSSSDQSSSDQSSSGKAKGDKAKGDKAKGDKAKGDKAKGQG